MLSKRSDALISAFVLTLYYVGVADGNNASDFVTMGDLRRSRRGYSHSARPGGMKMEGIGFQYTMRYQPGFHLHKLAQQQGEDGGMDGMEEPMPMPMPTPGTPPPEPAPTQPEEEEIPMRTTVAPTEVPCMSHRARMLGKSGVNSSETLIKHQF